MKQMLPCLHLLLAITALSAADSVPSALAGEVSPAGRKAERFMVHVGFSQSQFAGVNQNDAQAALRVYLQNLSAQSDFTTDEAPQILEGTEAMARALRLSQVEMLSLTAEEFLAVEDSGAVGPLLVTIANQQITEEYLLLVREESPVRKVADLKGRSLSISTDVRASLARVWLEVLCRQHGLGAASEALENIRPGAKPSLVILPVFFRQTDACVATRNAFNVMAELNPQLKRQLRIVAVSPPLVPSMTCFRRGLPESIKQRLLEAALNSYTQPSFQQVMALFKTERLSQQPVSVLASARELMATHRRLCGSTNGVKAKVSAPAEGGGR